MAREKEIYEAAAHFCDKTNPQLLVADYSFIPGDKLWAENYMNAKEIEKELNNLNIPCRIGRNCESGEWSIAIL